MRSNFAATGQRNRKREYVKLILGSMTRKYRVKQRLQTGIGFTSKHTSKKHADLTSKTRYSSRGTRYGRIVREFYVRDDNSRATSGKKETLTRNRDKKQKRLLCDTMKNLHLKFVAETPDSCISYSLFCRLRPFWDLQYSDTQGVIQVRHCDTAVVPTIQWYTGSDTGQTLCYCDGTCNTMIHREWYRSDTVILRWYLQYNDTQGVIQVRHCDTAVIPTIQWYTGSDTGQTLWYCGDTCNTVIHREWYRSDTVILLWYLQYNDRQGVIQVRHCATTMVPAIQWYTGNDTGQTLCYCDGTCNTMIHREWYRSDTVILRWYLQYNDAQGVIQVRHCATVMIPTIQWYTGSDTGQTLWYCGGTCNTMIHREWYRSDTVILWWYLQYNDTQGVIQVRHCDTAMIPTIQWYTRSDTGQTLWYCGGTYNTMIQREWYRSDTVILR